MLQTSKSQQPPSFLEQYDTLNRRPTVKALRLRDCMCSCNMTTGLDSASDNEVAIEVVQKKSGSVVGSFATQRSLIDCATGSSCTCKKFNVKRCPIRSSDKKRDFRSQRGKAMQPDGTDCICSIPETQHFGNTVTQDTATQALQES